MKTAVRAEHSPGATLSPAAFPGRFIGNCCGIRWLIVVLWSFQNWDRSSFCQDPVHLELDHARTVCMCHLRYALPPKLSLRV